jgi:hypothetical protein
MPASWMVGREEFRCGRRRSRIGFARGMQRRIEIASGPGGITPYPAVGSVAWPDPSGPGSAQSGDPLDERSGERGGVGQGNHVTGALDEGVFGAGHVAQN